jgi:hypothetical protein
VARSCRVRPPLSPTTINTAPVDEDTTDIFAGYWVDRGPDDDEARRDRRLKEARAALPDDINIWNRQRYLVKPGLAGAEDQGFTALRKWASNFYPDRGRVGPTEPPVFARAN